MNSQVARLLAAGFSMRVAETLAHVAKETYAVPFTDARRAVREKLVDSPIVEGAEGFIKTCWDWSPREISKAVAEGWL